MSAQSLRPLIFGEVLFDHFPDGSSVLGGAPFNVAWHLQAFGLSPLLISRIGNDAAGQQVRASMLQWGMDINGLQCDDSHPTGSVEVSFSHGEPHYDIVEPCAYDFIDAGKLPDLAENRWLLYHGSLALRQETSAQALAHIRQQSGATGFLDVNLRRPWWSQALLQPLLQQARWIKLNSDELQQLLPEIGNEEARIEAVMQHKPDYLLLTRGAQGATAICADGIRHSVRPGEKATLVDTVGAGDAFCSVLVAGLIFDWPVPLTLSRAQLFASAMVGIRGATTDNREFYNNIVAQWQQEDEQDV